MDLKNKTDHKNYNSQFEDLIHQFSTIAGSQLSERQIVCLGTLTTFPVGMKGISGGNMLTLLAYEIFQRNLKIKTNM